MNAKPLLFTLALALLVRQASALTLASYNFYAGSDGLVGNLNSMQVWGGCGQTNSILSSFWFTPKDAGRTFSFNIVSTWNPREEGTLVSSGAYGDFGFPPSSATTVGGRGMSESPFLPFIFADGQNFEAFAIEGIELHLGSLAIAPGHGRNTYCAAGTLSVFGRPVPDTTINVTGLAGMLLGLAICHRCLRPSPTSKLCRHTSSGRSSSEAR